MGDPRFFAAIERNQAYELFSSLNGTAQSSETQPDFLIFVMIVKKRPPYFAYNARSRFNMTPGIPLFDPDRRADQYTGSDPLISSRLLKRMILNPAVLPVERHSCPISSSVLRP
jgi:hypothetical protein